MAPYVKSNKNDRNDAEAICEAAGRPTMRFVPVKSVDQLAVQALHRIRSRLVSGRTKLANQIRGILAEHGIFIARNIAKLRQNLTFMIEGDGNGLSSLVRALVGELKAEFAELDQRIAAYDRRIRELYRNNELCQRLGKIEGVGPLSATALMAAVGDRQGFKNGRQFAAWLGLVPKQRSSGGRDRLFGISKRGDRYLRTLLIHVRSLEQRANRIQEAFGLRNSGNGGIPTSRPLPLPTKMPVSPGPCCRAVKPTILASQSDRLEDT